VPGKKKFGEDEEQPDRDHCPKCGVKLTQGEKDSEPLPQRPSADLTDL
jgi:hypothetical protein